MRLSCIVLGLAFATPASAAMQRFPDTYEPPRPELLIPQSQEDLNAKQVREGMIKFAQCIARRRPKEANDFVLEASSASWSSLAKRIDNDCALAAVDDPGEEVTVSSNSRDLLFALAEVLVQKQLVAFDPAQIASAAKLPPADPLATVGECAVRANPSGARDLLKTRLNSKEERQTVQSLQPALASCIPAGLQVRFDITSLRGTVAVNYYRLAFAPKLSHSEAQK